MRLYHRTTADSAHALMSGAAWVTRENRACLWASTRWEDDSQAAGYGDVVVEVEVDPSAATLDDEFYDEDDPDFEQHFTVPLDAARAVRVFTVEEGRQVTFT